MQPSDTLDDIYLAARAHVAGDGHSDAYAAAIAALAADWHAVQSCIDDAGAVQPAWAVWLRKQMRASADALIAMRGTRGERVPGLSIVAAIEDDISAAVVAGGEVICGRTGT